MKKEKKERKPGTGQHGKQGRPIKAIKLVAFGGTIEPEILENIDNLAKAYGVKRARMIRQILTNAIQQKPSELP